MKFGHWYEILLRVKWAKCGSYATNGKCLNNNGGFVELWVDRNKVVKRRSLFTMDDDGRVYLQ